MKLIFIRHGDPDYEKDSLTECGIKEAKLLSRRLKDMKIDYCYESPLGRAQLTAKLGLEGSGITPVTCDWLKEFTVRIDRPDCAAEGRKSWVCWDWIPKDWLTRPELFGVDTWYKDSIMDGGKVGEYYNEVCDSFDRLLAEHGYVRDGLWYRAEKPNNDTLVFFCHFGVTCVLLSHLMNCSPMILWQGISTAPTSLTTVISEERREGTAIFRASSIGDVTHLYMAGEQPSFSARFCECYMNEDERHD